MWQGADKNWERNKVKCTVTTWQLVHYTDGASFKIAGRQWFENIENREKGRRMEPLGCGDEGRKENLLLAYAGYPGPGGISQLPELPGAWVLLGGMHFTINCPGEALMDQKFNFFPSL